MMDALKNVPVWLAAELMGKSQMFVRMGLRLGRLPFGDALQATGRRWSYQISPKGFCDYQGCTMADLKYEMEKRKGAGRETV